MEHIFHIRQALPDLAIHKAQEVQGQIQLNQIGVHQNEVTQGQLPRCNPVGGHQHQGNQPYGNDGPLPDIHHGQTGNRPHSGIFIALQGMIIATGLMPFIAKIFDGFIIQQAIDGLGIGDGIAFIHLAAILQAPFRHQQRVGDIADNCHKGDKRIAEIKQSPKNATDHADFQQRRNDVEQHERQNEFDALGPSFYHPRQPAGLTFQMKTQAQAMQMFKCLQRDCANGILRDTGKQGFP